MRRLVEISVKSQRLHSCNSLKDCRVTVAAVKASAAKDPAEQIIKIATSACGGLATTIFGLFNRCAGGNSAMDF